MHRNSVIAFQTEILPLLEPGFQVLEVGAPRGNRGFQRQIRDKGCYYWYSDLSNAGKGNKITWTDEYRMECENDRFDAVVTAQTLEHVKWIWVWIKELARVTKPGGIVTSISPITWAEHRYPVDCWRVMPDGGAALLEWAGLEIIMSKRCRYEEGQLDGKYQMAKVPPVEDLALIGRKVVSARRYDFGDQVF